MEKMTDFFTARVDIYDDHMIHEVEGCREGYLKMAELDEDTSGSGMRNRTGAGGNMDQEPGDCRHRNRSDARDAGTAEEKVFRPGCNSDRGGLHGLRAGDGTV